MIEKFKKRPVIVDAMVLTFENMQEVIAWVGRSCVEQYHNEQDFLSKQDPVGISIRTLEGRMIGSVGDYIIKGVKGEFYPCKPDIFKLTYERV